MISYNVAKKDKKSGKGLKGSEETEFIILLYFDGLLAGYYGLTDSLAVKKPIADAVRPHRRWYNSYLCSPIFLKPVCITDLLKLAWK